jgi:hypothetical protein
MPERETRDRLHERPPDSYAQAIREVYALYANRQGKTRYGDKTPSYVISMDTLGELFPEARFVHIIRDGRNVTQAFMDGGWAKRVEDAAMYWKLHVERGRRSGRKLGSSRYREVRYEDLIDDPPRVLDDLCRFVDVAFDDQMLEYQESAQRWAESTSHPARHQNIQRLPTKGIRDWRTEMSANNVAAVERLVGKLLTELGYELSGRSASPRVVLDAGARWAGWQSRRLRRHLRKRRSATA